jgi:hypothetical protein
VGRDRLWSCPADTVAPVLGDAGRFARRTANRIRSGQDVYTAITAKARWLLPARR